MKTVTIYDIDDHVEKVIREKAEKEGMTLNETIKKLLRESLALGQTNEDDHREDFLDLFGVWSADDMREFDHSVRDFDKIDSEDWS
ncbi:hypothetical protein [Desulfonema magnum]|uniref:Ribbon helix-containing n=1 Tax=Desulfonema magnum TaxID=45655 RepID=A0A975BIP9_9BACT|nr:hypothetical protein [Desulfonema magnum]QTA86030.1 ribbon helix-containing [Desulfonema magnum]